MVTLSTAASTRLPVEASAAWIRMRTVCPAKLLMFAEAVLYAAARLVAAPGDKIWASVMKTEASGQKKIL